MVFEFTVLVFATTSPTRDFVCQNPIIIFETLAELEGEGEEKEKRKIKKKQKKETNKKKKRYGI